MGNKFWTKKSFHVFAVVFPLHFPSLVVVQDSLHFPFVFFMGNSWHKAQFIDGVAIQWCKCLDLVEDGRRDKVFLVVLKENVGYRCASLFASQVFARSSFLFLHGFRRTIIRIWLNTRMIKSLLKLIHHVVHSVPFVFKNLTLILASLHERYFVGWSAHSFLYFQWSLFLRWNCGFRI